MKQLYIHCGLHKTGTTSIQGSMHSNTKTLAGEGIHYPTAGLWSGGHHNIAWELCRDRRFDRRLGDLEALVKECAPLEGTIVLSSEDFESALLHPGRIARLLDFAGRIGAEPTFVVYLRDPAEYLALVYRQFVRIGLSLEFAAIAEQVLASGMFRFNEFEISLDYARIKEALAALPGAAHVVRDYHRLEGGSSVTDFAGVVGFSPTLFRITRYTRLNAREGVSETLLSFLLNRTPELAVDREPLGRLCELMVGDADIALDPELRDTLWQRHGRLLPESQRPASAARQLSIARLFSFETAAAARDLLETGRAWGLLKGATGLKARLGGRIAEWQRWAELPA